MEGNPTCPLCDRSTEPEEVRSGAHTFVHWRCPTCGLVVRRGRASKGQQNSSTPTKQPQGAQTHHPARRPHKSKSSTTAPTVTAPAPPKLPDEFEDWSRHETEYDLYATSLWFGRRADAMRRSARRCRSRGNRWRATYRAKLYESLAATSARLQARWSKIGSNFFERQEQCGHVPRLRDPWFTRLYRRYMERMLLALHWFPKDPLVQRFLSARITLGDKDYLRRAGKRWEKGVQRPYTPEELELDMEIMALHLEGLSLRQIHARLLAQGLLCPGRMMSHVAIGKRIKSLRREYPFRLLLA